MAGVAHLVDVAVEEDTVPRILPGGKNGFSTFWQHRQANLHAVIGVVIGLEARAVVAAFPTSTAPSHHTKLVIEGRNPQ